MAKRVVSSTSSFVCVDVGLYTDDSSMLAQEDTSFSGTGRFQVLRRLGEGGMGVVYEALDRERNTVVALKTLQRGGGDAVSSFKHEFRALQDVQHPNLVQLGELTWDEGRLFFTMELVTGCDFIRYVCPREGSSREESSYGGDTVSHPSSVEPHSAQALTVKEPVDEGRLRAALIQLSQGLGALHRARKVHRDIKPSNILVTDRGRVVILDFGILADLDLAPVSGRVTGTWRFMAPEQARGSLVGPSADWYSVGVLLYLALTGRLPFDGTPEELVAAKTTRDPIPPSASGTGIPADLDRLCMQLLRRDPRERPTGLEVLRRLGAVDVLEERSTSTPIFVGRRRELETLEATYREMQRGKAMSVLVHGESGMGKSAIVRQFTNLLGNEKRRPLVLAGRCYERESVPYKAVDEVIDALSRYLCSLAKDVLATLLPERMPLLATVFPVLRRLEEVAQAPLEPDTTVEPVELRSRLFSTLRDLLSRLAGQGAVVLVIDDLQWADADSLALLAELMRPPAPEVMFLATVRTAAEGQSASGQTVGDLALGIPGELLLLRVDSLPAADAHDLVERLASAAGSKSVDPKTIADEAGGHPLFIDALVRHRRAEGSPLERVRLEDALWSRIEALDDPSRKLLEAVAVAGGPLMQETAALAASVEGGHFSRLASCLRVANLARTNGARKTDTMEVFHDKVRQTILSHLPSGARMSWHRRLAVALEAGDRADPEALTVHWREAKEGERAAHYAIKAAEQASKALAFERSAQLYRMGLELYPRGGGEERALSIKLGSALANAGRGGEAARVFLSASEGASASDRLDLLRRAGEQFLLSGHVAEGVDTMRSVLAAVHMKFPATPRSALAAMLFRRLQIAVRGTKYVARDESQVAHSDLARIDACGVVASGMGRVDNIRAAYFQTRYLLWALKAGERVRLSRALAVDVGYSAVQGGKSQRRTARKIKLALDIARETGDPRSSLWVTGFCGFAASLEGRWREGLDFGERAFRMAIEMTGTTWERDSVEIFVMWCLYYQGRLQDLARRAPLGVKEAMARGDLYAATNLRTGCCNVAWLVTDQPDEAMKQCEAALAEWPRDRFYLQHYYGMFALTQIDLYRGDSEAAWRRVTEFWPRLRASMILRIQKVRCDAIDLRARCALACAARSRHPAPFLREARVGARRLEREKMPWTTPLAHLTRAAIAHRVGRPAEAIPLLAEAARGFHATDMAMHRAVAEWRHGQLVGGQKGETIISGAQAWMAGESVKNPGAFVRLYAPGYPEGDPEL
jgi:serine/threonine protein kinase